MLTTILTGAQMPKALAMPTRWVAVKARKPLTDQTRPPRKGSQKMPQVSCPCFCSRATTSASSRLAPATYKVLICWFLNDRFCEGVSQVPQAITVITAYR